VCGRSCSAAQPYNHRFDCCGQIAAHVTEGVKPKSGERIWLNFTNPMRAGYLTGPSQTTASASTEADAG
jgi:hypothetical protein